MCSLQPPRHISTLPETEVPRRPRFGRDRVEGGHGDDTSLLTHLGHCGRTIAVLHNAIRILSCIPWRCLAR